MDSPETSPNEPTAPEPTAPEPTAPEPTAPEPTAPEPTAIEQRRGVLAVLFGSVAGLGFLVFAAAGGLWAAVTARFMMPNVITEPSQKFKAGFPSDYPEGFVEVKYRQTHRVWIVNGRYAGRQEIFALSTVCTHLGCITQWTGQKFKCPCHGSGFFKDGVNFEGPAPRPLERFAIRIADDGQLEVDRSKVFQEELGQWRDPACYVRV